VDGSRDRGASLITLAASAIRSRGDHPASLIQIVARPDGPDRLRRVPCGRAALRARVLSSIAVGVRGPHHSTAAWNRGSPPPGRSTRHQDVLSGSIGHGQSGSVFEQADAERDHENGQDQR
jgi:hypothetical protein